eukprot:TRINITY_DN42951_c0_g1_i1.p2 TRINITY_DN42951_c0_g1~~TRINITY_DN42951_c0_g1_i1.p2  ORF type:complete len:165 (+),score=39.03 TRINITY_DN42951_c0_g1_i1:52-546(+)
MCVLTGARKFLRSAGVVVVRKGDDPKVLLLRRKQDSPRGERVYDWELPKGRVLENEDVTKVAVAKLKKETGMTKVDPKDLHFIHSSTYDMNEYGEDGSRTPATKSVEYFGHITTSPTFDLEAREPATIRTEWFTSGECKRLRFRHREMPAILRSAFEWYAIKTK